MTDTSLFASAIISALMRDRGDAPIIIPAEDVARYAARDIRIESIVFGRGGGFRVRVMPADHILHARLRRHDLAGAEQRLASEPRSADVARAAQSAKQAYGEALASLTPDELVAYAAVAHELLPDEVLNPPSEMLPFTRLAAVPAPIADPTAPEGETPCPAQE